jgi:hypothetical protein
MNATPAASTPPACGARPAPPDGGDAVPAEVRRRADACIAALELVGRGSRPLEDPRIFGPYNVAYVSPGNKQYGQPVGGRFRTGAGKLLFRTRGLFQGVFPPDVVTNKVAFSLFGCLPGAVGLRGRLVSVPQAEGGRDEKDTAKVFFDPPVLSLPGGIHARIGPPSSVVLTTTYLDERVRLGRGSRGSLFVFTRGGAAEGAELPEVGLQRSSRGGVALVGGVVAALVVGGGWVLARAQAPAPARAAGVVCMLVGAVLAGVFYRGGIIDGEFDRPEVQPPEAAA